MENLQSAIMINSSTQDGICERFDIQTRQRDEQINLISQYLAFTPSLSIQNCLKDYQNISFASNSSNQTKEELSYGQSISSVPQTRKKPSLFHNFQKHLITTIKSIVKLKSMPHHKKSFVSLAHEIWDYLCASNKISKRFLHCLLGKNIFDKKSSQNQNKFCKEYEEILKYFSEYSIQDIQAAQEYLCKEIIRQSHRILQCDQFKIGRMNKPQEFKGYFEKFVQELQRGKPSKRLPKIVKMALIKPDSAQRVISQNL